MTGTMTYPFLSIACAGAALLATSAVAAPVQTDHVGVELVSETDALVPGGTAWLGLRLVHAPHWHTYWINPGDSGLATKLTWSLPPDFRAGEINWPAPRRFGIGELFNFGYAGDALLPVPIDVPANARTGSVAHVAVEAKWLVCREECIPGKAALARDLPIATSAAPDPRWHSAFAAARAAQPRAGHWTGATRDLGDRIEVTLSGVELPAGAPADAFVIQRQVVGYAPAQIARTADELTLTFAKSEYFVDMPAAIDLVLIDGTPPDVRAWSAHAPFTDHKSTP